jgi:hypothetical protein
MSTDPRCPGCGDRLCAFEFWYESGEERTEPTTMSVCIGCECLFGPEGATQPLSIEDEANMDLRVLAEILKLRRAIRVGKRMFNSRN